MGVDAMRILYLLADLRSVGPTRQTLNIIKYSGVKDSCLVLTLFDEPQATLIDSYRAAGIKVECLHLNRRTFVFNAVKKIADFCTTNDIDVIHSYGVKPDIASHFAAKRAKVKHIITLRNFPNEDLTGRMSPWIGRIVAQFHLYALKRCEFLIACSKTIALKMTNAYGVDITPIQNGVDTTLFTNASNDFKLAFCEEFGIREDTKIFICTNSFIPRKHNDEIAEAFVAAAIENAKLFFLGDGPLLESMKKRFSGNAGIHFMGKRSDVTRFLQNADVFISASDSEGLPNAVLEAIACGCLTLLSDIPQHKEILEILPNCGKTFALHDVETVSRLIRLLFSSEICSTEISTAIMSSALTMQNMGRKYNEYYGRLKK